MKSIFIPAIAALTLAACSPQSTLVCDREAIAWDKWGDPTEMAENCLPAPIPAAVPVVPAEGDDPHDPMLPPPTPPNTPPSNPPSEPPSEPRVKGNNGWGNGDDPAPNETSRVRNNAENDTGGRSQRNHGNARSN